MIPLKTGFLKYMLKKSNQNGTKLLQQTNMILYSGERNSTKKIHTFGLGLSQISNF